MAQKPPWYKEIEVDMNGLQWDHPIFSKISYSAAQYLVQNHNIIILDDDYEESSKVHLDKFYRFYVVLQGAIRVRNLYIPENDDGEEEVAKEFRKPVVHHIDRLASTKDILGGENAKISGISDNSVASPTQKKTLKAAQANKHSL